MTTWKPFLFAGALPLAFSAVALLHVQRNRVGAREPIDLSAREVTLNTGSEENSGATAWITWDVDQSPGQPWLSREQLAALGFDTSVAADSPRADQHYSRQLPRRAFIVLLLRDDSRTRSRLMPVAADRNRARLLNEYPNGRTHVVTSGLIGVRRTLVPGRGAYVDGYVSNIDPRGIHVPTELADRLPRGPRPFTLVVRYGGQLEPWIVDVR